MQLQVLSLVNQCTVVKANVVIAEDFNFHCRGLQFVTQDEYSDPQLLNGGQLLFGRSCVHLNENGENLDCDNFPTALHAGIVLVNRREVDLLDEANIVGVDLLLGLVVGGALRALLLQHF